MKAFMDDNFLLSTLTAEILYHEFAKSMPICDYHCHLSPKEIAENRSYQNMTEIWLAGDHYKWRAMRSFGIEEKYITGNASDYEKFQAFAQVMPYLIGNPIYHWSHLELQRYFDIHETLSPKTCEMIWQRCNERITSGRFTAQQIIQQSNVRYIGTTDDPIDSLEYHKALRENPEFPVAVRPSFRPDRVLKIGANDFLDYVSQLADVNNTQIETYDELLVALENRITHFVENGCQIADHSLERVVYKQTDKGEVREIFAKIIAGTSVTSVEIEKYQTFTLVELGRMYQKYAMVMQLHIGALRNNNQRMFEKVGADAGFDSIDDGEVAQNVSALLNQLEYTNQLPKTIIYCLNPKDNEVLATMIGNFQTGGVRGKIQFGSGWWFNDQKDGMQRQIQSLAQLGLISQFVGMLTDSRSFLSYTRHEYFRRILCDYFGNLIENGEYPPDIAFVGEIIQNICFNNIIEYLGEEL